MEVSFTPHHTVKKNQFQTYFYESNSNQFLTYSARTLPNSLNGFPTMYPLRCVLYLPLDKLRSVFPSITSLTPGTHDARHPLVRHMPCQLHGCPRTLQAQFVTVRCHVQTVRAVSRAKDPDTYSFSVVPSCTGTPGKAWIPWNSPRLKAMLTI